MITRHKKCGTRKQYRKIGQVLYTPAYQSYFSAGDEGEPYCGNCDYSLEDGNAFRPSCGAFLVTTFEDKYGVMEVEGVV